MTYFPSNIPTLSKNYYYCFYQPPLLPDRITNSKNISWAAILFFFGFPAIFFCFLLTCASIPRTSDESREVCECVRHASIGRGGQTTRTHLECIFVYSFNEKKHLPFFTCTMLVWQKLKRDCTCPIWLSRAQCSGQIFPQGSFCGERFPGKFWGIFCWAPRHTKHCTRSKKYQDNIFHIIHSKISRL